MKELSVGVYVAWQIAAMEATAAKHQYIEKEHVLIGICSLEKVASLDQKETGLTPQSWQALHVENDDVRNVLREFGLGATSLRRRVRERLGKGTHERSEKVVHRSEACKKVFNKANGLAAPAKKLCCLHLFAAILEEPGAIIGGILDEMALISADLCQRALSQSHAKDPHETEPHRKYKA